MTRIYLGTLPTCGTPANGVSVMKLTEFHKVSTVIKNAKWHLNWAHSSRFTRGLYLAYSYTMTICLVSVPVQDNCMTSIS